MDKIANFFGRPGSRPDSDQRAPRLKQIAIASGNETREMIAARTETELGDMTSIIPYKENASLGPKSDEYREGELGSLTIKKTGTSIPATHLLGFLEIGQTVC